MRLALVVLCAASLLLPVPAVAEEDLEEQLEGVQERLEGTREGIQQLDRERTLTLDDLQRIDYQLSQLDTNLAALQDELSQAEGVLSEAEQRLADTMAKLLATEERLGRTQERLDGEQAVFDDRARSSFMFGGPAQMTSAMFDATDASQFGRALVYVERVMASDRDRVTRVAGLVREVEADTAELEVLQKLEAEARIAAQGERDRVAQLVEEEHQLRSQVASQREERQVALNALDADKQAHIELADALEAESQQLEEELRRRAEEERRRREAEEQRRREEEERRQREAEEQRRREVAQRSERSAGSSNTATTSGGGTGGGGSGGGSGAGGSGGGGGGAPAQAPASSGQLQRPASGPLTSGYGYRMHPIYGTSRMHTGIDFGGGHGAPIYAASDGVVLSAGARGGYGLTVIIDHGGGMTTLYAHQSRFAVSSGQQVSRGQVIGYIGSTGVSTGPHLHFEVRINGAPQNPASYL